MTTTKERMDVVRSYVIHAVVYYLKVEGDNAHGKL